ncbi:MAG: hypothetical protein KBD39_12400 [Sterolibacterium sp.]|nr:hypothetical protein [Sterolibacterium sp.]MBP9800902.1 hypothetical protein [Sterolibacterium sp.]
MNLAEYIAHPAETGETGQALRPFLDTIVHFNRSPESGDQPLTSGQQVDWPLEAKRIDELVTLIFYTSPDHKRLEQPCASLPLRECLQLSFDFPGADAIALVNADMHWKSFRKEQLESLLGGIVPGGYR